MFNRVGILNKLDIILTFHSGLHLGMLILQIFKNFDKFPDVLKIMPLLLNYSYSAFHFGIEVTHF